MILRFYRGIGPGTILLVIFSAILLWMQKFIDPTGLDSLYNPDAMPLHAFVFSLLNGNAFLGTLLSFIIMLLIAFYLANFNTRLFFITERTLLPASIYILGSGFLVSTQSFNPVFPASLLLVVAIDRVMASYRKGGIAYNFFDASLLLGLGSLFYFNIIWFYPVIIIGILLIRTFSFRELFLSLSGLLTPYVAVYVVYYISGSDLTYFSKLLLNNILVAAPRFEWTPLVLTVFLTGALFLIIALAHLVRLFTTKKIRTRKTFSLLIWITIISLVIYFAVPSASVELISVILVPYAYFISHFIVFSRNKKIANIVFAIIFIAIMLIQGFEIYT